MDVLCAPLVLLRTGMRAPKPVYLRRVPGRLVRSGALPLATEKGGCHNVAEMHLHSGSRAPTQHTCDLSKDPYTAGNLHHPFLTRTAPVQKNGTSPEIVCLPYVM